MLKKNKPRKGVFALMPASETFMGKKRFSDAARQLIDKIIETSSTTTGLASAVGTTQSNKSVRSLKNNRADVWSFVILIVLVAFF